MKVITYNLNGIRAAIGKGFIDWLAASDADVVCIQESKAQPDQIPVLEFEAIGYKTFFYSAQKKGYSGVGIITRIEPDKVVYGMGIEKYDYEGRFIRADFGDLSIVSVYHPSGTSGEERQAFKMVWLDDYLEYVQKLRKERPNLLLCGDYNIAHERIDIHDPVGNAKNSGFLPEEREWVTKFLNHDYIDTFRHFNKEPHNYTWWSFRANARANNKGWRIDYIMATESLRTHLKSAFIQPDAYHSDHCPSGLELEF
ncbi:MAG: exodeoxyribonuclease III [Bacteroidetes bacterium HGW-Bacteroidetes-6]|jgi:exodeoxyribonuclease-3|nr:MAG: exodeoxyribonuclease III [Bacteroidetes bacterium HGW-Bacteroidetes-6]